VYLGACKEIGVKGHPARFPSKLPEFFVRLLTDPGDLVVDIFAEGRRWLAFELNREYVASSVLRFVPKGLSVSRMKELHEAVLRGDPISIEEEMGFQPQLLAV